MQNQALIWQKDIILLWNSHIFKWHAIKDLQNISCKGQVGIDPKMFPLKTAKVSSSRSYYCTKLMDDTLASQPSSKEYVCMIIHVLISIYSLWLISLFLKTIVFNNSNVNFLKFTSIHYSLCWKKTMFHSLSTKKSMDGFELFKYCFNIS